MRGSGAGAVLEFTPEQRASFATHAVVLSHRLPIDELATDEAVADLLDRIPGEQIETFTMGTDRERKEDWRFGTHDNLPGKDLLAAVAKGRLWLNLVRLEEVDGDIARLAETAVAEVGERLLGAVPLRVTTTLIVSSPSAQVYYHADGQPNLLWHLRGRKHVWVYPALDERLAPQAIMEQVFIAEKDEELPYEPAFDDLALSFELAPGQVIAWPQNSPHRVVNVEGVNVSLNTEYVTRATLRRERVWAANRYFRTKMRLPMRSVREDGAAAASKAFLFRVSRRFAPPPSPKSKRVPTFRVDPTAELGYVDL